jgi:hypothetical protein
LPEPVHASTATSLLVQSRGITVACVIGNMSRYVRTARLSSSGTNNDRYSILSVAADCNAETTFLPAPTMTKCLIAYLYWRRPMEAQLL